MLFCNNRNYSFFISYFKSNYARIIPHVQSSRFHFDFPRYQIYLLVWSLINFSLKLALKKHSKKHENFLKDKISCKFMNIT